MALRGTVRWFSDEKGYGFVSPDSGGKDIFFHHTAIQMQGYRTLNEGDRVEFTVETGARGPQAMKISKLG